MGSYSSYSAEQLVQACVAKGDRAAWQEFFCRFHPVIARTALRTARVWGEPGRALLDDLIQEIYLKLCEDNYRLLCNFEARHPDSIYGFLKTVAINSVRDHFKARQTEKRGAGQNHCPIEILDEGVLPQHLADDREHIDRRVLLGEIGAQLERLAPGPERNRERLIFWLYYRQGLSAPAIAALPGIGLSTKGVESTLLRLTRSLRRALGETPPMAKGAYAGKGLSAAKSS